VLYIYSPLCLYWEWIFTLISDHNVVSVLKFQQATVLKLTHNKHNKTEIHYWLLLSHWTMSMYVTKIITEYYKSANLSTDSAPLHWPEARVHKQPLMVHLSVSLSLSLSPPSLSLSLSISISIWTSTNCYGCHHPSLKFVRSAFVFWYNVFGYNDVWAI